MQRKIKYSDEPLGELQVIPDFLPSPTQITIRDETVKVTISLSRASVAFFKAQASRHKTPYQKMIRRLLDSYAEKYSEPAPASSKRLCKKHPA